MCQRCASLLFFTYDILQGSGATRAWSDGTNAFVTSRLDTRNALHHRLPLKQIQRLQRVQIWAAHLVDGSKKFCHAASHQAALAADSSTSGELNGCALDDITNCVTRC